MNCPVHVEDWILENDCKVLRPQIEILQKYCDGLGSMTVNEPIITITFGEFVDKSTSGKTKRVEDEDCTLKIHRSHLLAAGGPLASLVSGPFKESTQSHLHLAAESFEEFSIIRKVLYCETIHTDSFTRSLPFTMNRWGIEVLFQAWFLVEKFASITQGITLIPLLEKYLPIMNFIRVSNPFQDFITTQLAKEFYSLEAEMIRRCYNPTASGSQTRSTRRTAEQACVLSNQDTRSNQSTSEDAAHSAHSTQRDIGGNGSLKRECQTFLENWKSEGRHLPPAYWRLGSNCIWNVLQFQQILPLAFARINNLSDGDHSAILLQVVLDHLADKLPEAESLSAIRKLDHNTIGFSQAIGSSFASKWPRSAWRILTLSLVKDVSNQLQIKWDYGDLHADLDPSLGHIFGFQEANGVPIIGSRVEKYRAEREKIGGHTIRLGVLWFRSAIANLDNANLVPIPSPLELAVKIEMDKDLRRRIAQEYAADKEIRMCIHVRELRGTACDAKHEKCFRKIDLITRYRTLLNGKEEFFFPVMLPDEIQKWLGSHRVGCGLSFEVSIRF